ncbi:MAG: sugar phosphate isomerase/epimerase family protein [Candidatus Saccharicenans sp.]
MSLNRRKFLMTALAAGLTPLLNLSGWPSGQAPAGTLARSVARPKPEKKFGFSLGLTSYTFRAFNLEQTINMTGRLQLEKITLKDFHLPLNATPEEIAARTKKVREAGLDLYGAGVVYLEKPEEVEKVFSFARTSGLRMIIASPAPSLLPLIEKQVIKNNIQVAIHNHGPGDRFYPTPAEAFDRIKNLDHRVGLCLDIGHAARAGLDPAAQAARFSDRLLDVHLKDVSSASAEGQTVEIGRGVIDIKEFLRTIIKLNYRGTLSFEFEKDEKDPLPGLAESVGYVRGLLVGLD